MSKPCPPASEAELMARARALSGCTLAELAALQSCAVPDDLRRAKGWVGRTIEQALGATAGSRAAPDFEQLGIELKTLPVDLRGHPRESTFVCTIPLTAMDDAEWESSRVRRKLARVLWIPVQGERAVPVAKRLVGEPLLWSPSAEEEAALRFDWEELVGIIARGDVEQIHGRLGQFLQIRPKANHSRSRRQGTDAEGSAFRTLPRGFYLRAHFTARILREHFVTAG